MAYLQDFDIIKQENLKVEWDALKKALAGEIKQLANEDTKVEFADEFQIIQVLNDESLGMIELNWVATLSGEPIMRFRGGSFPLTSAQLRALTSIAMQYEARMLNVAKQK